MKKTKIGGILPTCESDQPNKIIAKDKKFLSIAMMIMLIVTVVTMLVTFIVGIVTESAQVSIVAILSAVLSVLQILIMISVAHNISRQTTVLIKLAEKILGENPLPNANGQPAKTEDNIKENMSA